eukprot:sb/3462159/
MAKRNRSSGTGSSVKNIPKSARKFHIPALLKTEQIKVEVKPEIDTPCTDSKGSITSNNILFTCSGCGESGYHNFGSGYRLVKTASLVEVGTQTGDESNSSEIQLEDSIPATSTASPIIVSSDNDDDTSDDDECSDEDDCLVESGGEEEVSSSEDDMMLGLTDLSDSSEDEETNCLQQPTSPNISQQTLPQPSKQSVSFKSGSLRTSTRIKRAKKNRIQEPSFPDSSSHSNDDSEQTSKVPNEPNEQSSYFQCKIRECSVTKPSEQDLFEHVRIDHADKKHRCVVCPMASKWKTAINRHSRIHSGAKRFKYMAKRKLARSTGSSAKNISKSARKFHIPTLLKTEQIEVEVKPEIDTPCTDSKSSTTSNNILFTCSGCGRSGSHNLGSGYRLVKTAMLVEVGTQTGDESSVPEPQLNDSIPATSSTTPIIVSSDNDDDTSEDDECSDEDDYLAESGGEEEVSSSEDDMMLGLTDLSDSSEDDETICLQQPTSPNLSQQTLPRPSKQSVSLKSGSLRTSTRVKRAKTYPIQEPSSPDSSSHSSDDSEKTSKVLHETNEQSSYFQCKIRGCPVEKPSEQDLFEHVRIDHPDRKYRCNICPVAVKRRFDLARHKMTHSVDKPFECDECGKCFRLKDYFDIHCRTHLGDKRFECHECKKSFKRKATLQYHQLIHNKQRMVACRVGNCGLRMLRENLENHIKTAHPEYEHKCCSCPMTFKSNHALIVHKRMHNGDKPFKCKDCGKNFSQKSSFQVHQRSIHSGERPFKCKECGKTFAQLGNLKVHMRQHTGEKPFSCTICGEHFAQSTYRRHHEISCSKKL